MLCIEEVKQSIADTDQRVNYLEKSETQKDTRIHKLEEDPNLIMHKLACMQLHPEDVENRSRRNNLRLRSILEATTGRALHDTVLAILNITLEKPNTNYIELDRVHRVQSSKRTASTYHRDVLCRVHFFKLMKRFSTKYSKEGILTLMDLQ